jgi:DNA invertase Pin-like site-specific DNA recombinase
MTRSPRPDPASRGEASQPLRDKRRSSSASAVRAPVRKIRCAVYTRKSTEEGLEMEFNSLDAQREACEAYVASQRAEGWLLLSDRYDDGGFSGGTLERPALKRLLADIEAGGVDVVVVYKIDRLSRSLMDFSRLVEVFDRHNVTFVSITQSFNTTTSMGRLTLNVLLSFAQFEREVIGERIRDKFAASRRKGMWMGGWAPLGYEVRDRKLVVNEADAALVRSIFQRFLKTGSATVLARQLVQEGVRNKYGKLIDKGMLYKVLRNPVYIGEAVHKGDSYPGEHDAILDRKTWDKVQAHLQSDPRKRSAAARSHPRFADNYFRASFNRSFCATLAPNPTWKKVSLTRCRTVASLSPRSSGTRPATARRIALYDTERIGNERAISRRERSMVSARTMDDASAGTPRARARGGGGTRMSHQSCPRHGMQDSRSGGNQTA